MSDEDGQEMPDYPEKGLRERPDREQNFSEQNGSSDQPDTARPVLQRAPSTAEVHSWLEDHRILIFLALAQLLFLILFGTLARYDEHALPLKAKLNTDALSDPNASAEAKLEALNVKLEHLERRLDFEGKYGVFQDVHVMIFVGFGYLMTFLRRYGYSAVALNFLLAALVIEWHTIFYGFFLTKPLTEKAVRNATVLGVSMGPHFTIGLEQLVMFGSSRGRMIWSDFCAGSILISFGAVLGKMDPTQYLVMAFVETIIYTINEYLVFDIFSCNDVGGSMNLHAFGAYFGLAVAWVTYHSRAHDHVAYEATAYYSDIFSMLGTIFLWMFWPSFNSAIAKPEDAEMRAVVNTYYALCASCLVTFLATNAWNKNFKFDMDYIQNATLAGGVAVGSAANTMLSPFGAILIGAVAGFVSVTGFHFLMPFLSRKLRLHDTCGVHNLHGLPGIIGGIVGIIMAGTATSDTYGPSLTDIWPARGPRVKGESHFMAENRTASQQAGFQFLGLVISVALGCFGGAITGVILRLKIWAQVTDEKDLFNDSVFFEVPDDFKTWQDVLNEAEERQRRQQQFTKTTDLKLGHAIGI